MKKEPLYFTLADYALFERSVASSPEYDLERERVRDKFNQLHRALYPRIRKMKWDLHPHWMTQWLVSASRISPATARIDFMTLRYSKDQAMIKQMKLQFIDDFGHFYANAMLAARIEKEGFAIELLVSEKAWVDGQNLKARVLDGAENRNQFKQLLSELGGEHTLALAQFLREDGRPLGYQTVMSAKASRLVNTAVLTSTMDKYIPGQHDLRLGIRYEPEDKRLSADRIADEILERFAQLYPIYAFFSWSLDNDFRKIKDANQKTTRRSR